MSRPSCKLVSELLQAAEPPRTGRDRLITAAIGLFYQHGFGAVGIDQVLAAAGVTKSTFYKHFESKDELVVEAVRRRDEWESHVWERTAREFGGDDPAAQLLATLDVMDLWFNDPEFRGCMFLNAAAEFPNPHDPIHQAAAAHRKRTRERFRDLVRSAGALEKSAEAFADCFTALVEGAFVFRQTYGRHDAARTLRPVVEQLLTIYVPPRDEPVAIES